MKYKLIFIVVILLSLFPHNSVKAQSNFFVNAVANFEVNMDGTVNVSHQISITNATTEVHAKTYSLALNGIDPEEIEAFEGENKLTTSSELTPLGAIITVEFDQAVVGEGNSREFQINFSDSSLISKAGEVWEVSLPKLADPGAFESFDIRLLAPKSIGEPAYITPSPNAQLDHGEDIIYYFDKNQLNNSGITAAFGRYQVYSFDLTYHLDNPVNKSVKQEIAIPPDTLYQSVYYESIIPKPDEMYKDSDGNWYVVYELSPRQRIDARVVGHVQVYAEPIPGTLEFDQDMQKYLGESEYWPVNNGEIRKLAQELKTPENIYDYVINALEYDYDKAQPNASRLGAVEALKNPNNSICLEYTDLFLTLARAAGIPAREVNGYAYTQNPMLQPLSLVSDVLHAWPEYWDESSGIWVPVDPTWGDTTGGVNYFSNLDLRHIAFVIHGESPNEPIPPGSYKLGANPQKDVYVAFSELPVLGDMSADLKIKQVGATLFGKQVITAIITNNSPKAIYDKNIEIFYDDKLNSQKNIPILLPYQEYEISFTVPYGVFGQGMPSDADVLFMGQKASTKTSKNKVILKHGIIFASTVIIATLTAIGVWKHNLLISKASSLFKRI